MNDTLKAQYICESEKFNIFAIENDIYIEAFEKLDTVFVTQQLSKYPFIVIEDFKALRTGIQNPTQKVRFGKKKPKINLEISSDYMEAWLKIEMTDSEFEQVNKSELSMQVLEMIKEKDIVYGINYKEIENLKNNTKILVAKGKEVEQGKNGKVVLPEIKKNNVNVSELDGNANFYDLNKIYNVQIGDWVGERIKATKGVEGKNILGQVINPIKGRDFNIHYDKRTIEAVEEEEKVILKAKIQGALNYKRDNKTLNVYPSIEVENVDFKTGNINFEGFLIVRGTITDGFKVYAKEGIDVRGKIALSNVFLKSEGDISVAGGINGKEECNIETSGDVFVKFTNSANIKAKGKVVITDYAYHSIIEGSQIFVNKVTGGVLKATSLIEANEVGTYLEKLTKLSVAGFNTEGLKEKQNKNLSKIDTLKSDMNRLLQKLKIIKSSESINSDIQQKASSLSSQIMNIVDEINILENENSNMMETLKMKGEGSIKINSKIYPKSQIEIKEEKLFILQLQRRTNYYYSEGLKKD